MKKHLKLTLLLSLFLALFTFALADTVAVGSGTGSIAYFPIHGLYNYSYSQQIYLQNQIDYAGEIEKIRFFYVSGSIGSSYDWTIYMGHTNKTTFDTTTDWIDPFEMTQVYSGNVTSFLPPANNWMEIPLDNAFDYNNMENLVIAVHENSPGYTTMTWGTFASGSNTGIYYSGDGNPINLSSLPTAKARAATINRLQLVFPSTTPPLAPALVAPVDNATNLDAPMLSWQFTSGGGDPEYYDLYLGTSPNPPLFAENLEQSFYSFATHDYDTDYYWNVVAKNAIGSSPASDTWKFTTRDDPTIRVFPYIEDFGTTTASWLPTEWSQRNGFYPTPTGTTSQWVRVNWLHGAAGNNAAKLNIYGSARNGWLITRPIEILNENFELKFDLGLTAYNNSNPIPSNTTQEDDRFLVIMSDTIDMANPQILREYNNQGSPYVFNDIPNTGVAVTIPLTGITGVKYFAFYGESTITGNGDNDLHLDNVAIREIPSNPVLIANPDALDFGSVFNGATSESKNVFVSNYGVGILHLNASDVEITGPNADIFGFHDIVFPFALSTGDVGAIPVFVNGDTEGDVSATLEITYAGDTISIALSAHVLPPGVAIVGNTEATTTSRFPFGHLYGFERTVSLYKFSDIGSVGMLTSIGWDCSAIGTADVPYKIYIGTTEAESMTASTFANMTADLALVAEGSRTFGTLGWTMFELATPYIYTGGNLVVAVETNFGGGGTSGYPYFRYTPTGVGTNMQWNADNNPPSGNGTVNTNLPNLMLYLSALSGDPELVLNPELEYEFPLTLYGSSSEKGFSLSNIGGGSINVTQIALDDANFVLVPDFSPVSIGSAETHNFSVIYNPTTDGVHTANLSIETSLGNHIIELSGSCFDATIRELPYTENFDTTATPNLPMGWTLLNPDNPTVLWQTYVTLPNSAPNCVRIGYTGSTAGALNDWFITPPVVMEAGKEYRIKYYYKAYSSSYTENLTFKVGDAPTAEAMTITLEDHVDFNHTDYEEIISVFTPTADGSYYFGWYAYSIPNQYGIHVDDITIEELSEDPIFVVEPTAYDFGEVIILGSAETSIVVSNGGGGELIVTQIDISGNEVYSLASLPELPITLELDEFFSFDALFAPIEAGNPAATISIVANGETHTVALSGTCFDPTIRAFPFFDGFENGNTQGSTIISQWEQVIGTQYDSQSWTANSTETTYERVPRSGSWNATLRYNGEAMLYRPIMLQEDVEYTFEMYARQNTNTITNAKLTIGYGTEATIEGMTNIIVPETGLTNGDYQRLSGTFTATETGIFYIGIYGWINVSPWYISIDDITIDYSYIADPDVAADLGGDTTVTITGGGFVGALEVPTDPENLTPFPNPAFVAINHQVWQLVGSGMATLTFQNNSTEDMWFAYVSGGNWTAQELAAGASVDITIDLDAKDSTLEFALGSGGNPTLPVELSYFNAVFMVNENLVKLSWKTESETQMLGYQIYRSEDTTLANAIRITPVIVDATNSSTGANYDYIDKEIESGTYYYWLEAVGYNSSDYYGYQTVIVDIPSAPELPEISSMSNAYPNPFRSMTNIDIAIKAGETGTFTIYNMLGQAVYSKKLSEGNYKLEWNGRDKNGNRCGSGVYFSKLVTPSKTQTKKMLIMK